MHIRRYKQGDHFLTYYSCIGNRAEPHESNTIRADDAEELVEENFLHQIGDMKAQQRVPIPAEDHQNELDEALRAVDELTALLGTVTSASMRSRLLKNAGSVRFSDRSVGEPAGSRGGLRVSGDWCHLPRIVGDARRRRPSTATTAVGDHCRRHSAERNPVSLVRIADTRGSERKTFRLSPRGHGYPAWLGEQLPLPGYGSCRC